MASKRVWKSGTRGCWWAIVPRGWYEPLGPFPWAMGSTRDNAWRAWREWLGEHAVASEYMAIRVFITEAPDAK